MLEGDSNVTVERDAHRQKQYSSIAMTDDGREIDDSDEQSWNAQALIHRSLEGRPKVIVERDRHSEKQCWPIAMTEDGIQMDESDEQ
jgi:hypothetical protein